MAPISPKPSKVIIFDWDDTICPTSFVDQWKIDAFTDLPLQYQNLCNEIGKRAEKCLAAAAEHGEVIIITNSDDGWVNYSAERFVPNLLPILPKYRIVSARTRYERFYPGQPLCWKAAAFAHEVNEIYSYKNVYNGEKENDFDNNKSRASADDPELMDTSCESMDSLTSIADESDSFDSVDGGGESKTSTRGNMFTRRPPVSVSSGRRNMSPRGNSLRPRREIISFGDSMEERTAVKIVSGQLTSVSKSVMFVTSPTLLQLIGQLAMLTEHMKFVCEHESTLDLEISPHQAQKRAESIIERNKKLASPARTCGSSYMPRIRRTGSRSNEIVAASSDVHHHTRMD